MVDEGADDGTRTWIVGQGYIVTCNEARDTFKGLEWITNLVLPRRPIVS
jgi:hypothetical protein